MAPPTAPTTLTTRPRRKTKRRGPPRGRRLLNRREASQLIRALQSWHTARQTSALTSTGSRNLDAPKQCTAEQRRMTTLGVARTTYHHTGAHYWMESAATELDSLSGTGGGRCPLPTGHTTAEDTR
jgi:hypothetical protein